MTYNLVCDSSSDMRPQTLLEGRIGLKIVSLKISTGAREWVDDETLRVPQLLAAMGEEKEASSTACPSPAAFAEAFEDADASICFTISSGLSGTYAAAMLGRELALEKSPEKQICVIDSRSTAGVMTLLTQRAQALLEETEVDFGAVCTALRSYQATLRTVFTLNCYDNLIKNGRMRPIVGGLLHTLGIHIIAEATALGTIRVVGKARGEGKTFRELVEHMRGSKDCSGAEVVVSHCENLPGAMRLKQLILSELPVKSVTIRGCRGLTSFYAMQGGLILGY